MTTANKPVLVQDNDFFSMDDSFVPYGVGASMWHPTTAPRLYHIPKGWRVEGVFRHENTQHGLVYNPHIKTWFHLWWDLNGKCLTGNCQDGKWDLTWTLQRATKEPSRT